MKQACSVWLPVWILLTFTTEVTWAQGLSFTLEPQDAIGVEGEPFMWMCSAEQAISYSWYFNDAYIPNTPTYQTLQNGSLLISRVTKDDVGGFLCVASNGVASSKSRTAFLSLAFIDTNFKIQPHTEYKTTGEAVTFVCEINSSPPPTITWQHNKLPLETNRSTITMVNRQMSVLTLSHLQFTDEGEYMCIAKNPLLTQLSYSSPGNLVLRGKPEFLVPPEPVSAPLGSTAVFHCLVEGEPEPTVTWYDTRTLMQELPIPTVVDKKYFIYTNGTFLLMNIEVDDAGFYTCKANNALGGTSKTVLLTVTDQSTQPSFTLTPNNTIVYAGESVMWVCRAQGTPDPVVTWARVGKDLPLDRISFPYPGAMLINAVQQNDSGSYACQASSAGVTVAHQVELRVFVGPQFVIKPMDQSVEVGSAIRMDCTAVAIPSPVLFWSVPTGDAISAGTLTPVAGIIVYVNGTLVIAQVGEMHAGSYTCVAGNEVSTVTASVAVSVDSPPIFTQEPKSIYTLENSSPEMVCQGEGHPEPSVRWYHGDDPMPLQTGFTYTLMANGSLKINNVQVRQGGTYKCVLTNSLGSKQSSAVLTVLVPPRFQTSSQEVVTQIGGNALLDCEVTGSPEPDVRWDRAGTSLVLDSNMVLFPNNTLYISNLMAHQFGEYTCFANNRAGSKSLISNILTPELPKFLVAPYNITGNVSTQVSIPCMAASQLRVMYYWYTTNSSGIPIARLNYGLKSEGRASTAYVEDDGTLVFQSVREVDEGWYLCVAANSFGSIMEKAFLKVQFPPTLQLTNSPQSVTSGQSGVLRCWFKGFPTPLVSWQLPRGGFKLSTNSSGYVLTADTLTITSVDPRIHWGRWVCEGCNLLGCDRGTVELNAVGSPVMSNASATKDPITGDVILNCSALGTPLPSVTYFWKGQEINPINPPLGHIVQSDGSLRVMLKDDRLGPYDCSASNLLGSSQKVLKLAVPGIPSMVVARGGGPNSVDVSWTDPNQGALPVTDHVITFRPAGGEWVTVNESVSSTTHTVQGLLPFTQYEVKVKAINLLGSSGDSLPVTAITEEGAPGPPEDVKVYLQTNIIYVTWQPTQKYNGNMNNLVYEVTYADLNTSDPGILISHDGRAPYKAEILVYIYGHVLQITVRTVNVKVNQASAAVTLSYTVKLEAPLYPPTITRATPQGDSAIFVVWTVPSNQTVTGFLVDYRVFGEPTDTSKQVTVPLKAGPKYFNITGLEARTTYHIRVACYNAGGLGPFSATIDAQTKYEVSPSGSGSGSSNTGLILGIVAAVIVLLFLLIMLIVFCCYRRKKQAELIQMDIDRIYEEKKKPIHTNKAYESDTLTSRKSGVRGSYDVVLAEQGHITNNSGSTAFTISGNAIHDRPPSSATNRQTSYNPTKKPQSRDSSPQPVRAVVAPDTPTSVRSSRRNTEADFELNEMEYDEEIYVTGTHRNASPSPSTVYVVQETPNGLLFVDPETRYNAVPKMGTSPVMSEIKRSEKRKHRENSSPSNVSGNNSVSKRVPNSYSSLPRPNHNNPTSSNNTGTFTRGRYKPQSQPASQSSAHSLATLPRKNTPRYPKNTSALYSSIVPKVSTTSLSTIPRESNRTPVPRESNRTPVPPTRTYSYENGSIPADQPERPRSAASGISRVTVRSDDGFWRTGGDNSASLF